MTGFWSKSYNLRSSVADVAQLVESQIVILVVAGSSPVVRPTVYLKAPNIYCGAFSISSYFACLFLASLANSAAIFDILTASAAASVARLVDCAASAEACTEEASA